MRENRKEGITVAREPRRIDGEKSRDLAQKSNLAAVIIIPVDDVSLSNRIYYGQDYVQGSNKRWFMTGRRVLFVSNNGLEGNRLDGYRCARR